MRYLIKNGLIVDGTGNPAFVGSIVVDGDRIADVVPLADNPNNPNNRTIEQCETIDATGCLVTPGFIDAHTHSDD